MVIGLNFSGSPAAVAGFVVAVVVDAVDAIAVAWTLSHICKKVSEIIPSLAKSNTSPTVTTPVLIGRIRAAPTSVKPRTIFRPFLSIYRSTMLPMRFSIMETGQFLFGLFNSEAPTTLGIARTERLGIYHANISAFTLAIPGCVSIRRVCASA